MGSARDTAGSETVPGTADATAHCPPWGLPPVMGCSGAGRAVTASQKARWPTAAARPPGAEGAGASARAQSALAGVKSFCKEKRKEINRYCRVNFINPIKDIDEEFYSRIKDAN